jgi:hypothetical protein
MPETESLIMLRAVKAALDKLDEAKATRDAAEKAVHAARVAFETIYDAYGVTHNPRA